MKVVAAVSVQHVINPQSARGSLHDIARLFLKLGTVACAGPAAPFVGGVKIVCSALLLLKLQRNNG